MTRSTSSRRGSKANPCPRRTVRRVKNGRSTCSRKGVCPKNQVRDTRRGTNRNPSGCRMKKRSTGARRRNRGRGSTGSRKKKRCKPGHKANGRGGCTHNPRSVHWQHATTASEAAFLSQIAPAAARPPVPPANLPPASVPADAPAAPAEPTPPSLIAPAPVDAAPSAPAAEKAAPVEPAPVDAAPSAPAAEEAAPVEPTAESTMDDVNHLARLITMGRAHMGRIIINVIPRLQRIIIYLHGDLPNAAVVAAVQNLLEPLEVWTDKVDDVHKATSAAYKEYRVMLLELDDLIDELMAPSAPSPTGAMTELVNSPVDSVAEVANEVQPRLSYLGAYAQAPEADPAILSRYSGMVDTLLPRLDALNERTAADDGTIRTAIVTAQSLVVIAAQRLADGDSSPLSNPVEPAAVDGGSGPAYEAPAGVSPLAYAEDQGEIFPPLQDIHARCFYTREGRDDRPDTFGEKDTRVAAYYMGMDAALPGVGANALMTEVNFNPWGFCRANGLRMIDGDLSFDGMHSLPHVAHRMAERMYQDRGNVHGASVIMGRMFGRGRNGKKGVKSDNLVATAKFLTDLRAYGPEMAGVYRDPTSKKEAYAILMEFAAGLGPQ